MRYYDWEPMRKQMYKVHQPHRESGYIAKVDYQETTTDGKPDWEMLYTPGSKAEAEFSAFTNRRKASRLNVIPASANGKANEAGPKRDNDHLLTEFTQRGIAETKARSLVAGIVPGQPILDQLAYVDTLIAGAPHGKIRNPAGFYVRFIEDNLPVPDSFRLRSSRSRDSVAESYDQYCHQEIERFISDMSRKEYQTIIERHGLETRTAFPKMASVEIEQIAQAALRQEILESGRVKLPTLEQSRRTR